MIEIPKIEKTKGTKIIGFLKTEKEGFLRIFLAFDNWFVLFIKHPLERPSEQEIEKFVDGMKHEVQLDPGCTGWTKDFKSTVVSPDSLKSELRSLLGHKFNDTLIFFFSMRTKADREYYIKETAPKYFGSEFEEWYTKKIIPAIKTEKRNKK